MAADFAREAQKANKVKPVLQALVLAERIWDDKNGQKIIAGTFNAFHLKRAEPPEEIKDDEGKVISRIVHGGQPGSPYAYISLTDVCDDTHIVLQFVSLTRNEVLFDKEIVVKCSDRLRTVEIIAALPPIALPEPGVYAFEVVCEGEVIGSHRIIARADD